MCSPIINILAIENINKYMSLIRVDKYLQSENIIFFTLHEPMHYRTRLADRNTLVVPDIRSIPTQDNHSVRLTGCHYIGIVYLIKLQLFRILIHLNLELKGII